MQAAAVIASILGGIFELGGLAAVVLQIKSDRERARALLTKDRAHRPPKRKYPPDLPIRGEQPTPSELSRHFEKPPSAFRLLGEPESNVAALANLLSDQRQAVDKERDELEVSLLREIDTGDEELRDGFREILAGNLRLRTAGVAALAIGIVLTAIGSALSSLS